jgi:acid phosphatase family membrane protein YuiD
MPSYHSAQVISIGTTFSCRKGQDVKESVCKIDHTDRAMVSIIRDYLMESFIPQG